MTPPELPPAAVQRFAALVREATGNVIPAERHPFLAELIERRARATGQAGVESYLDALATGGLAGEWSSLVPLLTIKESYLFRAPQQLDVLRQRLLPALLAARAETRRLCFWSAACARGEEPATLALLLAEDPALAGWSWSILATDVDEEALEAARRGLYGERAVAQVSPTLLQRWFTRRGKLFELAPALRARIDYRPLNLAQPPYDLPEDAYDLVLLRNLLIYFRRPLQRRVVDQVALALAPDGYLMLGASETLWQLQGRLESVDFGACFAYRHAPGGGMADPADPPLRPGHGGAAVVPDALSRTAPVPRPRPLPAAPPRDLLAPPAPEIGSKRSEPATERLQRAARQLAGNRVEEAARELAAVLEADPVQPAAHALKGFLHDLAGRTEEAVAAYRAALYLDPQLYQARLLLAEGLLRLGRRDLAENQFREVLATLDTRRARSLVLLGELPLPNPERAGKRSREVLGRG
jgi:chemotaxis protein methyltransferase CheR